MRNESTKKEETVMAQVNKALHTSTSSNDAVVTGSLTVTHDEVLDQYREYVDSIRPPPAPRASIKDIELLSQTIAIRIWAMRSKHDLATVLTDGFFDELKDVRLRKNDRVEVIASWDEPVAEHAVLCVDAVDGAGKPAVSLMLRYERQS
jgi:hypothetical protein